MAGFRELSPSPVGTGVLSPSSASFASFGEDERERERAYGPRAAAARRGSRASTAADEDSGEVEDAARSAMRMNLQARYQRWEQEGMTAPDFRAKYGVQHLGVLTLLMHEMCAALPGLFADPPGDPSKFESFLLSILQQDEDGQQGKLKLVTKVYFLVIQAKEACMKRELVLKARYEWMKKSFESRLDTLAASLEKSVNTRGQLARDRERVFQAVTQATTKILSVMRRVEAAALGTRRKFLSKQYVLTQAVKAALDTLLQAKYSTDVEKHHYERQELFETVAAGLAKLRDVAHARLAALGRGAPAAVARVTEFLDLTALFTLRTSEAARVEGPYLQFRASVTKIHGMVEGMAVPTPPLAAAMSCTRKDGGGAEPASPQHAIITTGLGEERVFETAPFRRFQKAVAAELAAQDTVDKYVQQLRVAKQRKGRAQEADGGGGEAGTRSSPDAYSIRAAALILLEVWGHLSGVHDMLRQLGRKMELHHPTSRTCEAAQECVALSKKIQQSDLARLVKGLQAQYAAGFGKDAPPQGEKTHAAVERCRQLVVGLMHVWPFYDGFAALRVGLQKLSKATYVAIDEQLSADVHEALYLLEERVGNIGHASVTPDLHVPYAPPKPGAGGMRAAQEEADSTALRNVELDVELHENAARRGSGPPRASTDDGEATAAYTVDDAVEAAADLLKGEALLVDVLPHLDRYKDLAGEIAEQHADDDSQVDLVITAIACAEHLVRLQGPCCAQAKRAHEELQHVRAAVWDLITFDGSGHVYSEEPRATVAKCVDRMEAVTKDRKGRWDAERLKLLGVREDGWAKALAQMRAFAPGSVFHPTLSNQQYEMRRFEDVALAKFRKQQEAERKHLDRTQERDPASARAAAAASAPPDRLEPVPPPALPSFTITTPPVREGDGRPPEEHPAAVPLLPAPPPRPAVPAGEEAPRAGGRRPSTSPRRASSLHDVTSLLIRDKLMREGLAATDRASLSAASHSPRASIRSGSIASLSPSGSPSNAVSQRRHLLFPPEPDVYSPPRPPVPPSRPDNTPAPRMALPAVADATPAKPAAAPARLSSAERRAYPLRQTQPQLAVSTGPRAPPADPILGVRRGKANWRALTEGGAAASEAQAAVAAMDDEEEALRRGVAEYAAAQRAERRRFTARDDEEIAARRQQLRSRAAALLAESPHRSGAPV